MRKTRMGEKQYLGDDVFGYGVYVWFDGYSLVLTTEDGTNVMNHIVLEPPVYAALSRFVKELPSGRWRKGKNMSA